jgi:GNAT superfamily N-acetyltransferase
VSVEDALQLADVKAANAHDLRRRVLRSHMPEAAVTSPEDDAAATVHVAARRGDRIVGVVTMFLQEAPSRPGEPAMRFRWMAVDPVEQRTGVGTMLMREVFSRARAAGTSVLWANGRDTALGFYTGLGFTVVGDAFDDEVSLLPHHLVVLDL